METESKDKGEDIDIQMDVDMDALAASDTGTTDVDTSIPDANPGGPILEDNDMPDPTTLNEGNYISKGGLDNLDSQMDKELGVEDKEPSKESDEYQESYEQNETKPSNEEYSEVEYFNAPFDELKERLGEDFQIPEGVDENNYMDKLLDVIYKNTNFEEYVHPQVRELNAYMKEGGSLDEYVGNYNAHNNIDKMSNQDLVRTRLANDSPEWSDQEVDTVLRKMDNSGILDVEASRIRKDMATNKEGMTQRMIENQNAQRETAFNEEVQDREEQIKEAVEAFDGMDDVYGLPVSKAERQEFKETFRELVTPDKNGMAPLMSMLQSNETLAKIAYILSKGDSAVRTALTNAKESTKDAFIEKLDPSPRTIAKSGAYEPGQINLDALSAPERYRH